MSDPLIRFLIVIGVAMVAGLAVWAIRRSTTRGAVRLDQRLLGPGTYLFTSTDCAGCAPARDRLAGAIGGDRFREIRWDDQPEVFEELEITVVPATLVVDESRRSTLYPGDAADVVAALNP